MEQNQFQVLQALGGSRAPVLSTRVSTHFAVQSQAARHVPYEWFERLPLKGQSVSLFLAVSVLLLSPQHLQWVYQGQRDAGRANQSHPSSSVSVLLPHTL